MTTILMVEDEMALAMLIGSILEEAGHEVVRAARLAQALDLVATRRIDAACLDVNLAGEAVFPVAMELRRHQVPFVFASGYGANGIPEAFADCPVLKKPYLPGQLLEAVDAMLARGLNASGS